MEAEVEDKLISQLIDKNKKNTRGVPTMVFIDNVEAWIEKFTGERILEDLNSYLNKYKYMEANILKHNEGVKLKIPDMEKAIEVIEYMAKKKDESQDALKVDYMVSNNLWAKAEVEIPDNLFLWLGADIMCEYTQKEAKTLLNENKEKALAQLKNNEADLDFVKDQITVCEVNTTRIYNEVVKRKQAQAKK